MKILLVKPDPLNINFFAKRTVPYLALQVIASLTPSKHIVETVDEPYETIDFNKKYDLVGISCMSYGVNRGYQIADEFRKRKIKVVLGGCHPSAMPYEAKQHADSVVIGEAELTWPQLLEDLENGELKSFYYQKKPVDPELIPPARRDITKIRSRFAGIEASRGCPICCDFCSISNKPGGKKFRPRPIENVIEEIKSIEQKFLFFYSPSMTIDPEYTKSLFDEMIGLNKKFSCDGNVNVLARDEKLLKTAKKAGCVGWTVGFESVSQKTIENIGKKSNKIEDYKTVVKNIYGNGMVLRGGFIFGFDEDTLDTFDETLDFVYNLELNTLSTGILTPYPGTPLFDRLESEGRILTRDWSKYTSHHVVFQPKNMSPDQLYNETVRVIREFNSFGNNLKHTYRSSKLHFKNIFR